jgi:hypothetical protein
LSVKTHLLLRRVRGSDDARVLACLEGLPSGLPDSAKDWELVGIANDSGEIYRVVQVRTALQMIALTARLNALGYSVDTERQSRSYRYARVFSRKHSGQVTNRPLGGSE